MARRRTKKFAPGETMPIAFRIDGDLAEAIEREAERLGRQTGLQVSRVDVIRKWLREAARTR